MLVCAYPAIWLLSLCPYQAYVVALARNAVQQSQVRPGLAHDQGYRTARGRTVSAIGTGPSMACSQDALPCLGRRVLAARVHTRSKLHGVAPHPQHIPEWSAFR